MKKESSNNYKAPLMNYSVPDEAFDNGKNNKKELAAKNILREKGILYSQNTDEKKKLQDMYSCKRLFLETFVSVEMMGDFPLITRDFLQNEYSNIKGHELTLYIPLDAKNSSPYMVLIKSITNMMMNAVDFGSEYARDLFLYLYKKYYRKEYQQLKRFSHLSVEDIFNLSVTEDKGLTEIDMARLLTIADLSGIEIDQDCGILYEYIDKTISERPERDESKYISSIEQYYTETYDELLSIFDSEDEINELSSNTDKFITNVLRSRNYMPEYVKACDGSQMDYLARLRNTYSVLKSTYGDKKFTKEELIAFSGITYVTDALLGVSCVEEVYLDSIMYNASFRETMDLICPVRFDPDEVRNNTAVPVKTNKKTKEETKSDTQITRYKEEELLEEIEDLRKKIHNQESDIKYLRKESSGKKRLEDEIQLLKAQLDSEHKEVIALRNHLYSFTEEDVLPEENTISVDEMKRYLNGLRIIIIGGHTNWQSKMKQVFPDWTYIDATVTGTVVESIVNKADYVYFYTDILSHSTYYKYVNIVRDRGIEFGYIHGVNIENTVYMMYKDLYK